MSGFVSRGFGGRRRVPEELEGRLPRGDDADRHTRAPEDWTGHRGRIDASVIPPGVRTAYVCGGHGFVETASRLLLDAAVRASDIRTERYGPA